MTPLIPVYAHSSQLSLRIPNICLLSLGREELQFECVEKNEEQRRANAAFSLSLSTEKIKVDFHSPDSSLSLLIFIFLSLSKYISVVDESGGNLANERRQRHLLQERNFVQNLIAALPIRK